MSLQKLLCVYFSVVIIKNRLIVSFLSIYLPLASDVKCNHKIYMLERFYLYAVVFALVVVLSTQFQSQLYKLIYFVIISLQG